MRAKSKELKVTKQEPPKLQCVKCREWVETMEKDPTVTFNADGRTFRSDGPNRHAWTCPACRGEVAENPVASDVAERREAARAISKADHAADRELKMMKRESVKGPVRRVVSREPGAATTERGTLECGHVIAVMKGAERAHCRKCKKKPA